MGNFRKTFLNILYKKKLTFVQNFCIIFLNILFNFTFSFPISFFEICFKKCFIFFGYFMLLFWFTIQFSQDNIKLFPSFAQSHDIIKIKPHLTTATTYCRFKLATYRQSDVRRPAIIGVPIIVNSYICWWPYKLGITNR